MFRWLIETPYAKAPKPPELPKYDPKEEEPKWSLGRLVHNVDIERPVPWPKVGDQPVDDEHPDWRGVIKKNVIPLQTDEYKLGKSIDKSYFFFDTPDYADPFKKLWSSFKILGKYSVGAGVVYAIFQQLEYNLASHIFLAKRVVLPIFISGMATSLVVITVANLRGNKDDYYNYVIGGLAGAASIANGNYMRFNRAAIALVPIATGIKYINENNDHLVPQFMRRVHGGPLSGLPADDGTVSSGDLRFGVRFRIDDPGRDIRRYS